MVCAEIKIQEIIAHIWSYISAVSKKVAERLSRYNTRSRSQ